MGGHFKPCARAANRFMSQAHYGVQSVFERESFSIQPPVLVLPSGMFKRRLIPSGLALNCCLLLLRAQSMVLLSS